MKLLSLTVLLLAITAMAEPGKKIRVGLVLDKGGRDDKSFNAAAYQGAMEAQKKLGIDLKVVESSDDTALEPSHRTFAQHHYDLIIGIGFVQAEAVKKVAAAYPKVHFLLVDSPADAGNIRSVTFKEHEGAYLVGAIAALTTKTKTVGFIGGMDIPLIRRFELGYRSGVQSIDKKIRVVTNYVGSSSDAWKNPMKGKELALAQYQKNADIIFAAAGASALGAFDAAEEKGKFVIGVDSNQDSIKPGRVLTSMLKRLDRAVYDAIEMESQGKFAAGKFSLGLAEGGIDFSVDSFNRAILTPGVEKQVNDLKAKILRGEIKVPDYYETEKKAPKSS
jgi:basic membrane protein A